MGSEVELSPSSSTDPEDLDCEGGSHTDPTADPATPDPVPPNEAEHESTSTGGTQATEPEDSKEGSRRVGGERRYSEWCAAHPEWRANPRQSSPLDPNQALLRILDLRNKDRRVGANLATLVRPSTPTRPSCEYWTSGTRIDT